MRGKAATKRETMPDNRFHNTTITKLINLIMRDGKKITAEAIVYSALDKVGETMKLKPLEAFNTALDNIKPKIEVRSRRVGGANYQVPVPVSENRQLALALRWLVAAARESRGNRTIAESLATELAAAIRKEGSAFKKREDTHRMAEANKAFSHLSW